MKAKTSGGIKAAHNSVQAILPCRPEASGQNRATIACTLNVSGNLKNYEK